jgi:hypothetical protein
MKNLITAAALALAGVSALAYSIDAEKYSTFTNIQNMEGQ